VAGNNFKLPADNEVCRNLTTIGSMLFQWLARLSCSVIASRGEFSVVTQTWRPASSSARGEASEAAAALEAIQLLRLAPEEDVEHVLVLLDRLCAMLTRLAGLGHRTREPPSGS
jgi:hypothetical protein